jgi:hypothetical protein
MSSIFILALFMISSVATVFLFLLSLRKLGSMVKNYASLFTGIDHLLLSMFVSDIYARSICLVVGMFITIFSFIKIIRKMD